MYYVSCLRAVLARHLRYLFGRDFIGLGVSLLFVALVQVKLSSLRLLLKLKGPSMSINAILVATEAL